MYEINGAALGQAKFTLAPHTIAQIRAKPKTAHGVMTGPGLSPEQVAAMKALVAERAEARAAAASGATQGWPTWAWAVVGVGGAAALFGVFVFLRRRRAAKKEE